DFAERRQIRMRAGIERIVIVGCRRAAADGRAAGEPQRGKRRDDERRPRARNALAPAGGPGDGESWHRNALGGRATYDDTIPNSQEKESKKRRARAVGPRAGVFNNAAKLQPKWGVRGAPDLPAAV